MSVVNTNYNALVGINMLRMNNLNLASNLEKLTTGLKINKSADDPSGMALATIMTIQIRGFEQAIQNVEDLTSLIGTADGAIHESQAIAQRMRDLAVRGANEAVLTNSDRQKLYNEYNTLAAELNRKYDAVTFNTKEIFNGALDAVANPPSSTQYAAQIGPDNNNQMRVGVSVPVMEVQSFSMNGNPLALSTFYDPLTGGSSDPLGFSILNSAQQTSVFQGLVEWSQSVMTFQSNVRTNLGVLHNRMRHVINETWLDHTNISQSRSRILDTDFASQIADFTKNQIFAQSATAALAQANANPQAILQLLQ